MSVLTIGIPTYNRPHLLPRALRAALYQSVPVRVIVADDGDTEPTEAILASSEFSALDVVHLKTGATAAWPNWRACAMAAETEYFAWLQDDDTIRETYAERIIDVMDYFPEADLYMARLQSAYSDRLGMPFKFSAPWVPMDFLEGKPACWPGGQVIAASSYVTSWALCPAQAYRVNDRFREMLDSIPDDCDMFVERLVPSRMAALAPVVFDPVVAGYWIQHASMLSKDQANDPAEVIRQFTRFFAALDYTMDIIEGASVDWSALLYRWLGWIPPEFLSGWLENVRKLPDDVPRGRYLDRVINVLSRPFNDGRQVEISAA
jgi:hypothetical protein